MSKKKQIMLFLLFSLSNASTLHADIENYNKEKKQKLSKAEEKAQLIDRKKKAKTLSLSQDELSADVQEMIEDQTNEQVIQSFEEVEELMAQVTDNLSTSDTGKSTLYHQTKIIEKIFEAAKKKGG